MTMTSGGAAIALPAKPKKAKAGNIHKPTLAERHAAMTDTSGGLFACHTWRGSVVQQSGYGQIWAPSRITGKGTMRTAHSVAWEVANECTVPAGRIVRHVCHNPLCCNPAHLLLGGETANRQDDRKAGKRPHRLTKSDVMAIVEMHKIGIGIVDIALGFRSGVTTVRNILRGKTWSKVTGIKPHKLKGGRKPKVARVEGNVIILDTHVAKVAKAANVDSRVSAS